MSEQSSLRNGTGGVYRKGSLFVCLSLLLAACSASKPTPEGPQYIFAWPFVETSELSPRGGTTRGESVTLAAGPTAAWTELQKPGQSRFEKDRAAILAMAGDYRASFDFLETVVFEEPYEPARPYRSWGTERVYVVEDRGDFISLQHILEMVFIDEDGNRQGPFVQKHWRQDWQYEPGSIHEYVGDRRWKRRLLDEPARDGRWSQSVWQVDDTPRYASVGAWEHTPSYSAWTSERTGRPLPRRESTVRKDYDLLDAVNRHTILPQGWVHEEDNLKTELPSGEGPGRTRAREVGVNRYETLEGFDFGPADTYLAETEPFWAEVRKAWTERLAQRDEIRVGTKCGETPIFMEFFGYAEKFRGPEVPSPEATRERVAELLDCITD